VLKLSSFSPESGLRGREIRVFYIGGEDCLFNYNAGSSANENLL
jgi:hypothetical protein